jgi:hypothetical protein
VFAFLSFSSPRELLIGPMLMVKGPLAKPGSFLIAANLSDQSKTLAVVEQNLLVASDATQFKLF